MNENLKEYRHYKPVDFIKIDPQDYAEDRLIEVCDRLEETGIDPLKIASGLIFALHNLLYKIDGDNARTHYSSILEEIENNICALDEVCETSEQVEL